MARSSFPNFGSDTRREARRLIQTFRVSVPRNLALSALSLVIALVVAALCPVPTEAMRVSLFILVLASALWVTEAIPAFAVAVVVIALQIAVLGKPGGVFTEAGDADNWTLFIGPWASPLMFLFLGGFVLAQAATHSGLDRFLSLLVVRVFGSRPTAVLAGCMLGTFVFSMFMSNTAAAAMMISIVGPLTASLATDDRFVRGLYLSIPVAANLGGMGTIIGTPPNAIAAGLLAESQPIDFLDWMIAGLPPAILLLGFSWLYIRFLYPCSEKALALEGIGKVGLGDRLRKDEERIEGELTGRTMRIVVMLTFALTVGLWVTDKLHGIPTAVVSFVPITIFSVTGILSARRARELPWDVMLLLAGGLSLGTGVKATGLADWLAGLLPGGAAVGLIILLAGAAAWILSNVASNTAIAAILLPIVASSLPDGYAAGLVPIALCCSMSMMLPVSTPPNAVAFASGKIATSDFLRIGFPLGILGIPLVWFWCRVVG